MNEQLKPGTGAVVKRFTAPIYLVCLLCIIAPPLDLVLSLPSLNPSSVEWRFGALGLLTGAVVLPLIGLLIGIMAAVFSANRMMYGLFATLGFVGTVVLVAALLLFALDAIQLRGQMPRRMIRRFDVTVVKAILMQIVQLIALGSVLWAGRRAMRAMPQPEREIGAGLVRG